jgi:hypothetical protein
MALHKHISIQRIRRKRTIRRGEPAYDVDAIGTQVIPEGGKFFGHYQLRGFDDSGVDYWDSVTERSIMSIGRRLSDNAIIASLTSDLYMHPEYECLWLR